MVEAAPGRRETIKQELLKKAKSYFDSWEEHKVVLEVPERHYVARQTFDEEGNCITIVKYKCMGFTEEHWQQWKADPIAVQQAMNDRMSSTRLDDDEGCKVFHIKMNMPMMISNRSIVTCFYEHEDENGYRIVQHSSQGNDDILAAKRKEIGKDVVARMILTYMAAKPIEGGFELNQMVAMDIAGMIPGFVKNKIAKKLANVGLQISDYVMHGTIPPKIM